LTIRNDVERTLEPQRLARHLDYVNAYLYRNQVNCAFFTIHLVQDCM